MRVALTAIWLTGCASALAPVEPSAEITAIALTATKDPAQANMKLKGRVIERASEMKNGIGFVFDRRTSKAVLKLGRAHLVHDLNANVSARQPQGFSAHITVSRSGEELSRLATLRAAHVQTDATSSDPGKALLKADAAAFREAIVRTASDLGRKDSVLRGKLTIINYALSEEGRQVAVTADIAVAFVSSSPKPQASSAPASMAASQPKTKYKEGDEPDDEGIPQLDWERGAAEPDPNESREMVFE